MIIIVHGNWCAGMGALRGRHVHSTVSVVQLLWIKRNSSKYIVTKTLNGHTLENITYLGKEWVKTLLNIVFNNFVLNKTFHNVLIRQIWNIL